MPEPPEDPLLALKNIGPVAAGWLREIGVESREDLERIGPVLAYRAVKHRHPQVSVVALYAFHGALTEEPYTALAPETRLYLRDEAAAALAVPPATRP